MADGHAMALMRSIGSRLQQQELFESMIVVCRMWLSPNTGALADGSIDILLFWERLCRGPLVTVVTTSTRVLRYSGTLPNFLQYVLGIIHN